MLAGALKNYSLGGPWEFFGRSREVRKSLLESSGGVPEAAERLQKALREGKKRPRASKRHLGAILVPSWCDLGPLEPFGTFPYGGPWAAFGEDLGRLGRTFLGDLVAHPFLKGLLTILGWFLVSKIKETMNRNRS